MTADSISVPTTVETNPGPISAGERIIEIDILRGFALFGILLVNMSLFINSFFDVLVVREVSGAFIDRAAAFLVALLAEGKFYSLFSFLFGFGLAIQMARAEARGVRFVPFYLRRLFVLLVIGLLHATLLWTGDILVIYAVLGLLLILFRKAKPKTLLIWAIVFLVFIALIQLALLGLAQLASMTPEGAAMVAESTTGSEAFYRELSEKAGAAYSSGSFVEATRQRVSELGMIYLFTLFIVPNIFAMFLLGLAAGKQGIFNDIPAHLPFFRKLMVWGLVLGGSANLIFAYARQTTTPADTTPLALLGTILQTFGAPLMSAFYLSAIILLVQNPLWRKRLAVIAPVGRMALSNYLFQSLLATTLFYGYGFGLYGKVGAALGVLITIAIYLVQIPISNWWMKRFQFGPVEWLWRTLTYGKAPTMVKQTA